MRMSPGASRPASVSTVPSVIDPAGTIIHTARGAGMAAIKAGRDCAERPPWPSSSVRASAFGSKPITPWPARNSRCAMLAPMRPSPIMPSSMLPPDTSARCCAGRHDAAVTRVIPLFSRLVLRGAGRPDLARLWLDEEDGHDRMAAFDGMLYPGDALLDVGRVQCVLELRAQRRNHLVGTHLDGEHAIGVADGGI